MPSTYTPIATSTLGSSSTTVTFSSIPATYTDLVLVVVASNSVNDSGLQVRFNGDSGTNYSDTSMYGNGSGSFSFRTSNQTGAFIGRTDTGISNNIANIQNYSNTTTYKTVISRGNDGTMAIACVGMWRSTAAINSVTVLDQNGRSFPTGSTFTLYGVKSA